MTTEPTSDATTDGPPTVDTTKTTTAPAVTTPNPPARSVRTGTVIWGLVLTICGVGMVAAATGRHFDLGLAVIVVVGAAGLALLIGSLVSAGRRR
ncbi:MAG: LMBR1 domain-containing protein [Micrococcales bacterium]|nr:LMBR1 domain-containing protein [Micrococcales bacterium]